MAILFKNRQSPKFTPRQYSILYGIQEKGLIKCVISEPNFIKVDFQEDCCLCVHSLFDECRKKNYKYTLKCRNDLFSSQIMLFSCAMRKLLFGAGTKQCMALHVGFSFDLYLLRKRII